MPRKNTRKQLGKRNKRKTMNKRKRSNKRKKRYTANDFKLFKNSLLTPNYRSPLLKLKGGKWGAEEPFNTINSYSGNVVGAPIGGGQYGG